MTLRKSVRRGICAAATVSLVGAGLVALTATPAVAATTNVVVGNGDVAPGGPGPWQLEPTSNSGSYGFVSGPASPPAGVGSLHMKIVDPNPTPPPASQHEWLNNYSYGACQVGPACNAPLTSWQPLATVDTLKFSAYRASGGTYPSYNIETDYQGTGSSYTTFVFVPNAASILNNTWQTWDATNPAQGTWYSTTNTGVGTPFNCNFQAAGCNHSWAEIQTGYPAARVRFGLGPNVGSGGNFDGNIDNFTFGPSTGTVSVFNFEPDCTTDCFVDAATGNDLNTGLSGDPMKTIQAAVNRVSAGGTVHVAAGTYVENVTVPKSVDITGAGATTIVEPALSAPNTCSGSSICPGGSNVFLVQSSNVTIDHLKIDGDNPSLSGGVNVGGANIDARNGIITDHTTAPCNVNFVCNNLSVHDVTVDNIYLRGIYASAGITFNFANNTVDNVQADPASVAIFAFLGAGTMSGNHVSNASDAIASNHSRGTMMTGNVITLSASGVHTDNAGDSGGTADVLSGNNVSSCTTGGYGVWTFVAYKAPSVSNNTVSGCDVGLANFASCKLGGSNPCPGGVVPTVTFSNNTVSPNASGAGLYVTTNSFGFGDGDAHVSADHNHFNGPGESVFTEEDQSSNPAQAMVQVNRNTVTKVENTGTTTVDASCNYWGQSTGPGAGQVVGPVTSSPWLVTTNLDDQCVGGQGGGGGGGGGGPTIPGAPRSVYAVPGNARATVTWKPPASNGGSGITSYIVTPIKGGVAQSPRVFSASTTSRVITSLTNGASYKFQIAARNSVGTSATSTSSGAITVGAPGAPPKPTVTKVGAGQLKVQFTAPSGNGAPITGYTATCASKNGGVTKSKAGSKSPITVTGLSAGKTYACRVAAKNSRGTGPRSVPSTPVTA